MKINGKILGYLPHIFAKEGVVEDIFQKVREAKKLIDEAKALAAENNKYEGEYYGSEMYTSNVLDRYFEYYSHEDIEDYWYSSGATC